MHFDCHLEVCSLTGPERVEQHLRKWKPSGVVFVQKGSDRRSRIEWVSRLDSMQGACGVALISDHDLHLGLDDLSDRGTCGARISLHGSEPRMRSQDEVLRLHEAIPRTWHIELDTTWSLAARLAPCLARMHRTFCLTPKMSRTGLQDGSEEAVLWWFDMGNVYLKLTGPSMEHNMHSMSQRVCRHTPDRVVLGSGEPHAEAGCWWSDEDFFSPDQADDNAQRLYPFFRSTPLH